MALSLRAALPGLLLAAAPPAAHAQRSGRTGGSAPDGGPRPVTVRGTLLGAGGEPMPAAHVVVHDGPADATPIAAADDEGRFSPRIPRPDGHVMHLLGVHHGTLGALPLAPSPRCSRAMLTADS
ncbi:MAG: hypothetical protein BRD48_01645 [Bacteroidetes bacterium QS_9_68_14]|nr:MAG: hypothetical protein BRD48_01645 [Bacteroidetes bacterium QS_9_68_14]